MESRNSSYSIARLRRFAIIFSIAFSLLFALIPFLRHPDEGLNLFVLAVSFFILFFAVYKPYALRKPYLLWLQIGSFLGSLNSKLILALFFYLIITPISIIAKCAGAMVKFLSKRKTRPSFRLKPNAQISSFSDQH